MTSAQKNQKAADRKLEYFKYEGPDPVVAIPLDMLAERVALYKEVDGKLKAADGDKDKAVQAWIETSDHAEAVKLRKAIEMATQKLKDLAEKNAKVVTMTEEEKEAAEKLKAELKDKIRAGQKAIIDTAEMVAADFEGVKAAVETIGDPSRTGRGRKPGEAGSSTPRAYVIATVNGGNLKDQVYDTFSKVAAVLHSDVAELQKEFAKAAGVDPAEVAKVDKPVEFQFQANGNGTVYTISTKPKPREKPGRKPGSGKAAESKPAESTPEVKSEESTTEESQPAA